MVVFEERRVTPLLVAEGLSPTPGVRQVSGERLIAHE